MPLPGGAAFDRGAVHGGVRMFNPDLIKHDAHLWGSVWTDEPEPRELVRAAEVVKQLVSPRMPIRLAVASVIKRLEGATISSWYRLVAGDVPSMDVKGLVFVPPEMLFRTDGLFHVVGSRDDWVALPIDKALRAFELDDLAARRLQGSRGLLACLRGALTAEGMRSIEQLDDDVLANRIAILRAEAVAAFGAVAKLKATRKIGEKALPISDAEALKRVTAAGYGGVKKLAETFSVSDDTITRACKRARSATPAAKGFGNIVKAVSSLG